MCDYSLMGIPNRLAREGEDLVAHRFPTGSMGFASSKDLCLAKSPETRADGIWSALKLLFNPPPRRDAVAAVCIPPGARLVLQDVPARMQRDLGIGEVEQATFTQLTASEYAYRDAIRFENGRELLLQKLCEGQRAKVVDLSGAEAVEPVQERIEWAFRRR